MAPGLSHKLGDLDPMFSVLEVVKGSLQELTCRFPDGLDFSNCSLRIDACAGRSGR